MLRVVCYFIVLMVLLFGEVPIYHRYSKPRSSRVHKNSWDNNHTVHLQIEGIQ